MQPELLSGMRTRPPAGMMFIQHPGRDTEVKAVGFPSSRSKRKGSFAPVKRLKAQWSDVDRVVHL